MWIVVCVVVVLAVLLVIYFFGEGKHDLSTGKKEFKIYGLKDGFVPQGICFSKSADVFLISGYMKSKSLASRIYVVNGHGEFIKFICVKSNGTEEQGHFGGIATFGNDVWISTDQRVLRVKLSDIKNAKSGDFILKKDEFPSKNAASFVFVNAGILWIGEFYKLGKFKTDVSHHVKFNGLDFHAMCFGFKIDPSAPCGIASLTPQKAISIPDLVQGMAISGNNIFVSTSYGISRSNLLVFKNILTLPANGSVFIDENKVPLYVLSPQFLIKKLSLPAMSEEVEVYDKKLFLLFESASKKYRYFTRRKVKNVYSISMNIFDDNHI